jgi:DNA polymerase elongation subunit (family B)
MKGGEKGAEALGIVGKYCVQDSVLVVKLFGKLEIWFGLTEMAKTCKVPIFFLYTRGQGIKVFSQVYLYAMYHDFVVEENGYIAKDNEHYQGAHVFEPVPGTYDKVVPFDFNSLYPSTIIDQNICMSTLAVDEKIKDSECNIIEWSEHVLCEHDTTVRKTKPKAVICEHFRYRFLKEPRGALPSILMNLLEARTKTKNKIAELKKELKEIEDDEERENQQKLINVLNQRQLSYKISANSAYGILGSNRGYLPFMPGASCTTASARNSLEKAAKILRERYKVKLVYGDSVTEDTPVLVRYPNGTIDIKTIETIGKKWESYDEFKAGDSNRKEKQQSLVNLKVWSDGKWVQIKRVIRHKTQKKIYRILTHTGCVDVTEDHSLLNENREKVKPTEVKVGDKLLHSFPKEYPEILIESEKKDVKKYRCGRCKETRPEYEFYKSNRKICINNRNGCIYNCKECCWEENEKHRKNISGAVKEYFSEYEYVNNLTIRSREEAFVWGFFMADGSCGKYRNMKGRGNKCSWAINNQDVQYLEKAKRYLEEYEPHFEFKILDTFKSSRVYKLVCKGRIRLLVEKYRKLFYDKDKYKIVPYQILNAPVEIKNSFFEGYYTGDGYKSEAGTVIPTNGRLSFCIKGKIGAQGLFYLLKSIGGYNHINISISENKPNIFWIYVSTKYGKDPVAIKKIIEIDSCDEQKFVYDLETDNGMFGCGIGELTLKNTDSAYVILPGVETAQEIWDRCLEIEEEMLKDFRRPMKLAFERIIYWRFFILTKKRYMWLDCGRDGKVSDTVGKKGVLLARRDNCKFVMDMYREVVMGIFHGAKEAEVLNMVIDRLNACCAGMYGYKNFVVTKSIGEIGDYKLRPLSDDPKTREKRLKDLKCPLSLMDNPKNEGLLSSWYNERALPAHAQLAQKMRRRGMRVDAGQRLEYLVTTAGGPKAKLFEKIEDPNYQREHSKVIKIDYLYYIHSAANQLDQVLGIQFGEERFGKFVLHQYRWRVKKWNMLREIEKIFSQKIVLESKEDL